MTQRGPKRQYARGHNAIAECQRSGQKMRYRDLVEDGHVAGLLVHPDWWEPKHPQEIPVEVTDPIALYRPAPEISIEDGYGDPEALDGLITPTDEIEAAASIVDDFNRDVGDIGPLYVDTAFVWERLQIYSGGVVSDQQYEDGSGYRTWGDGIRTELLPEDQFAIAEYTDYVNADGLYYVASWLWLRADNESGYYLYLAPDLIANNSLEATWTSWYPGNTGSVLGTNTVSIPGSLPDGIKIRAEVIGTTLYSYYNIGAGWVTLVPPADASSDPMIGKQVGFGFENWTDDSKTDITNFWAGATSTLQQGIVGSLGGDVTITDDFNRAGPGMGPDWNNNLYAGAGGYDFTIVNNELIADPSGYTTAGYAAQPFDQDAFAEIDIGGIAAATEYWETSLYLRTNPDETLPTTWVTLWGDGHGSQLMGAFFGYYIDGVWFYGENEYPLDILTGSITGAARFRAEIVGDTITGYLDDVVIVSGVDSALLNAPGRHVLLQLLTYSNAMPLDNFRAGSLGTTGAALIGGEALVKDDFNRVALGSDWTTPILAYDPFTIVSNQLQGSASAGAGAEYIGETFSANHYASVELYNMSTAAYWESSISLRADVGAPSQNEYWLSIYGNSGTPNPVGYYVVKYVGGVQDTVDAGSLVGIDSQDIADGTIWRVEVEGDTLRSYIGDALLFEVTDKTIDGYNKENAISITNYSSGDAAEVVWDNFRAGHIALPDEPFVHAFTGTLEYNLTGGERSVAVSEAVTFLFNAWLVIDLDDGTQFITRIATGSDSPTFLLPLTTAFPAGSLASAGNTFYIGAP